MSAERSESAAEVVELRVPTHPKFASTVRLVAASLAADAQFTVDDLDDLRSAVHEVFANLAAVPDPAVQSPGEGHIVIRYHVHGSGVEVKFALGARSPLVVEDLAALVGTSVDDLIVADGTVTLVKHRRHRRAAPQ